MKKESIDTKMVVAFLSMSVQIAMAKRGGSVVMVMSGQQLSIAEIRAQVVKNAII